MSLAATYDGDLSRVQLSASSLGGSATRALVERSHNQVWWDTIRGGRILPVTAGAAQIDDYEFFPNVTTYYRVTSYDDGGTVQEQFATSVAVTLDRVWLKNLRYPFLNRPLWRVLDRGEDRQRPARGAVSEVTGRSAPVAARDVRASQRFTIHAQEQDDQSAGLLDLSLAAGGVILIQTPADKTHVGGGYVDIDTTAQQRSNDRERYVFVLPCTVVAPPGVDVVPTTLTVGTLIRRYGSIGALWAAHPTIRHLWDTVGDPDDLVVI